MRAPTMQRTPQRRAPVLLTIALAGRVVIGTGCRATDAMSAAAPKSSSSTASRVVEWEARDYRYEAPDILPSGWVTIRMMNHGPEPHHGQLLRLNDGVTFQAFSQTIQQEGRRHFA